MGNPTEFVADPGAIDELNALARRLREPDARGGLEAANRAHELARTAGYARGLVDSLVNQSHCNNWLSHFSLALSQALEALRLASEMPAYPGQADLLLALARSQLNLANFSESIALAQRAQLLAHESGDRLVEADALNLLGISYYRLEQYELCFAAYQDSMALHRASDNPPGVCKVMINIAQANSTLQQFDQALAVGQQALEIARASSSPMLEAYTLHTLGQVYADQGNFAQALEHLQRSLPAADAIGNQYVRLVSIYALGQVYGRWQKPAQAAGYYQQGLELAEALQSKLYIFRCHEGLAACYESQSDWRQALAHYQRFHSVKESVFNEQNLNRIHSLESMHALEKARQEAEFYQQRNAALEQEIAHRKTLEAELQRLAATDALTGTANRRRFIELAEFEIERAVQQQHPLALAAIDLDHLKQVNDTCGHALGDRALLALAQTFQANIRLNDVFARFGGDEFLLLLPETTAEQAYELVERIRRLLVAQPVESGEAAISITISVGVTTLNRQLDALDDLLARADEALYCSKTAGRNCVSIIEA